MWESEVAGLTRENLSRQTLSTLQTGRRRNPDVLLVQLGGRAIVVKDFGSESGWVRRTIGRWITAREVRAYRALTGHSCVPRLLGRIDALSFALEHRPGRRMSRRLSSLLPASFVDELERAVAAMHQRGVVHLDLRHRSNVLADPDGRPILIDFASALCFRPGGWPGRLLVRLLGAIDRAAVAKWRARLVLRSGPPPAPQASSVPASSSKEGSPSSSSRCRGARRPR